MKDITITNETNLDESYGPGKFNTLRDVYFYNIVQDGGCDDEYGSVSEIGIWHGLIYGPFDHPQLKDVVGVIVSEDDQGFFISNPFYTKETLDSVWKDLTSDFERYGDEDPFEV